jgi:uncharacterized protein YndB with AHSA1/START domain
MTGLVATATTSIEAPREAVWKALTDPDEVRAWFFGTDQRSDWTPGSSITWSGEWEGKPYQDKGEVLAVDEPRRLEVTHWSPLSGTPDVPESYHTLVYELRDGDGGTELSLRQDNNADQQEADRNAESWAQLLAALKAHVEGG